MNSQLTSIFVYKYLQFWPVTLSVCTTKFHGSFKCTATIWHSCACHFSLFCCIIICKFVSVSGLDKVQFSLTLSQLAEKDDTTSTMPTLLILIILCPSEVEYLATLFNVVFARVAECWKLNSSVHVFYDVAKVHCNISGSVMLHCTSSQDLEHFSCPVYGGEKGEDMSKAPNPMKSIFAPWLKCWELLFLCLFIYLSFNSGYFWIPTAGFTQEHQHKTVALYLPTNTLTD